MATLKQVKTKKGKTRYWVDFDLDRRHQRKFQLLDDACEYLYLNWFCYKINHRSVMNDAVFFNASLVEMIQAFYGLQVHKYKHSDISYNTLIRYKQLLKLGIDCKLCECTAATFANVAQGKKTDLRSFFNCMLEYDIIKINPIKVKKYRRKLPYVAKKEDLEKLSSVNMFKEDKLLIDIANATGARIGEIVTLSMTHITDKTISFVSHEVNGIEVYQTKSGLGRTIRVQESLIEKIKANYINNDKEYVFWNDKLKRRITVNAFRKRFEKYGFTKFHSLRHRAASSWIDKNVSPLALSKAMGHHSVEYTFYKYGHLINAQDQMPTL